MSPGGGDGVGVKPPLVKSHWTKYKSYQRVDETFKKKKKIQSLERAEILVKPLGFYIFKSFIWYKFQC